MNISEKYIEPLWESFKQDVIPKDASKTQIIEMRKAFYCGIISIMRLNALIITKQALSPKSDVIDTTYKIIIKELEEFLVEVIDHPNPNQSIH